LTAANEYGQTVLGALREVEDALAQEKYQVERIELLNTQVELARQASLQLREAYLIGEADFLDRLSAVTEEQRLQREILSARLELVLIRVRLYLALAGSFDPRPEIRPEIAPPPALPAEQLPPPGQAEEERSPENVIDE
jgi:outer membrane protein TolC